MVLRLLIVQGGLFPCLQMAKWLQLALNDDNGVNSGHVRVFSVDIDVELG